MTDRPLNRRMASFGVSIFTEMSRLALEHEAVNLSQGYPDFDGPEPIKEAAIRAIREGRNQYVPSHGTRSLRRALARAHERYHALVWNPESEITIHSGATEAIFSTVMALVEPGDEVICLEPFYDSYPPCVAMAGGTLRPVTLRFPGFEIPWDDLEATVGERTRLLVLNTPQNPCGKVYTREELSRIAGLCREHDVLVLSDEVYEHLTYDGAEHIPMAALPGMRERTVTISSTAKTFSLTGWKVGFTYAPEEITRAIRLTHQFVTFCTPPPFQLAMAEGIERMDSYLPEFRRRYTERRDLLYGILSEAGFAMPPPPHGSYFLLADFSPFGFRDDREFCVFLTREIGVAAVPPSYFYEGRRAGRHLARFAFCKTLEAIREAGERLRKLADYRRE